MLETQFIILFLPIPGMHAHSNFVFFVMDLDSIYSELVHSKPEQFGGVFMLKLGLVCGNCCRFEFAC